MKKLFVVPLVLLASCKHTGPDLSVCLSDPANNQAVCSGYKNKEPKVPYSLPYSETDNYIMLSPDDTKLLLDYCKLNKKEKSFVLRFLDNIKQ